MSRYDRAWSDFWSVAAAAGVGLALLESPTLSVLLALGQLFLLGWLVQYLALGSTSGWRPLTVAIAILTTWSLCRVSPSLGLLVVLLAGVSSPAVVHRVARSVPRSPAAPTSAGAAGTPTGPSRPGVSGADSHLTLQEASGPLNGLDDQELCRLWRESFWVLRRPASPGTLACLVALRRACLDELERRDAPALHAWLLSGARASSGPEKYLARPSRRDPHPG